MVETAPPPPPAALLAAQALVEVREPLDRQLSPLGLCAIDALALRRGDIVVDVGCGTGQTLLQLADRVGVEGRVIGVDIAPLPLAIARQIAEGLSQVSLVEADASKLDLPRASVDAVFSRFGVMAFHDPVAAFANLHRMLKPTGRLAFVCWRALAENELDLLPVQAAGLEHLVDQAPFSLASPPHIRDVLQHAGFHNVGIVPDDQIVTSGDLDAMMSVLLKVGALGRILRHNPTLKGPAEIRLRAALAARGDPACVALQAATWIVTARA